MPEARCHLGRCARTPDVRLLTTNLNKDIGRQHKLQTLALGQDVNSRSG
jgi:hypothetical protein